MKDNRKDCPMRHENGNCTVIGGFCTAVNDPICGGLHNAYDLGYRDAAILEKRERENPKPLTLDELRQMDGEPVWLDVASGVWGLVDSDDSVVWLDRGGSIDLRALDGKAYRHKPKEG